ncbi:membrane peptidoglycan carboxypeptidase [Streptomyces sp. SLBN-118]|uniref:transglycosylase domain-containing protein n=1 Tax=Streptomyces sp. SLBN-118 TaxID=2768454 RepID=UPI0011530364|nr:transglycosylase domain-containing protein [Streptomyces sp. SLBN-118]TQK44835.1 membrane peptidoglycan carboxypeptidase [Streptomyces sp. SLBN-118]
MSDEPQRQGWTPRDATVAGPGPGAGPGKKGTKTRPGRTGWRRLVPTWRMVLGAFLLITLLLIGGFLAGYMLVDIPSANAAATAQSNVYLYKDGTQIARDGEVNRENVGLAQVPLTVQRAVLAAEDRDFYSERAVDPKAMVRAAWNTLTGKGRQSGSTITQQYVKNYYLGQEQTISRKWKEFFIAIKLGREESKSDILEGYLNTSYFGRNAYGIQAAAQAYYGKDIKDLDTAQGAYLASLLNAPSAYDVATHPENRAAALARWNYTLDGMVTKKWLSPAARAAMTFPVPRTAKPATGLSGQRGYIVQAVEDYLTSNKIIDENTLATGGYRITTTLQRDKQNAFRQAVDDQVMSRLAPDREADRIVRVGGASIDPATGKVLAMYGGVDYTKQYVNNATRRDYQVGSTFKPFVFTSAVEHGSETQDGRHITPNTVYDGTNRRPVQGWSGKPYAPANEDDFSYGPITVRTATDRSVNAVYAQMALDVGPARVRKTATALGIPANTPDLHASPSIALGPATASVLDMTEAYATLANHGRHGTYTLVEKVSKDGIDVPLPKAGPEQAVSREAADTTTSILQSVVEGGTGTEARSAGRPAAGKTGTAEEDQAAWFAGYTPDLATVVAVMGQDPATGAHKPLYGALGLPRINGGGAPAKIWGQFTGLALEDSDIEEFDLELQEGAEEAEPPEEPEPPDDSPQAPGSSPPSLPPGQTQGQDQGQTQGQNQGQSQGQTGGQTDGGTDDGGTTDGGQTDGGQTDGGTTTGGGTDGGTATGGTADGGTTTGGIIGGNDTGGGTADGGVDSRPAPSRRRPSQ